MAKSWRFLAWYSDNSGAFSDDIEATDYAAAVVELKRRMQAAGDTDPESIEIIEDNEITPAVRASDHGLALAGALRQAIGRLSIHEVDPAWNALLHHVYGAEWLASHG